jgi:hypothetical protein
VLLPLVVASGKQVPQYVDFPTKQSVSTRYSGQFFVFSRSSFFITVVSGGQVSSHHHLCHSTAHMKKGGKAIFHLQTYAHTDDRCSERWAFVFQTMGASVWNRRFWMRPTRCSSCNRLQVHAPAVIQLRNIPLGTWWNNFGSCSDFSMRSASKGSVASPEDTGTATFNSRNACIPSSGGEQVFLHVN